MLRYLINNTKVKTKLIVQHTYKVSSKLPKNCLSADHRNTQEQNNTHVILNNTNEFLLCSRNHVNLHIKCFCSFFPCSFL